MRLFGKSGLALIAASAFLPGSANGLEASIKQVSCGSCEYVVTLTPTEAQLGAQIGISISTSGAFGEYKADQTSFASAGISSTQLSTRLTATWTVPFTTNADATALFAVLDAGGTFFVDPTTGSSSTSQVSEAVDLSACTTTTTTSSTSSTTTTTNTNTSRTTPTSTRSTIASSTSGTFITVTTGAPASTSFLPSSDQSNGGRSNVGAIAGGAVGGILVSALSGFLLLFC
ncbi:unnamed protein product [Tilletia laevis]|uniref:Uncharacterized protein n=3 Tax=Tilletia TaxID=13289 RepID=A0A8X7SUV2_9BASI|nr:hypothetical protein CF336_g7360 [Tilletia laevis]KAE8243345.1 hypothetical protein A4X06_0g6383 [Tilletia controversa]KAE8248655.1 hypothetical protein A4X03_0g6728 [Tilletia caries]KAE8188909.1 hypothetical protein CF335_g6761 [Tilletia laevis]CAD6886674.1 unnamed protein product [Tilletia caries]